MGGATSSSTKTSRKMGTSFPVSPYTASPIAYGVFHYLWPNIVTERAANHGQLAVGALSTFLLIFLWTWTVQNISLAFFVLSFGLSIVDCTSSVTFLPFMANFRSCYLTPYLVGEGLSGLLPSLVAIAQGIENPECINETRVEYSEEANGNITKYELVPYIREPRFSPECFFVILLSMVLFSWLAFILLDKLPFCQKEKILCKDGNIVQTSNCYELETLRNPPEELSSNIVSQRPAPSKALYLYLLFLQLWASIATFGVFPAVQSYSCLPYGDVPFHTAVTLCGVAYPAACLLAMFLELRNIHWISWLTLASTLVSVYAMVTAVLSPDPPLVGTTLGSVIIVICWVSFMFSFSYIKTVVTVLLGDIWGHDALFWCGAVTQGGAVVGALLMFLLVNVFHLFHDDDICVL